MTDQGDPHQVTGKRKGDPDQVTGKRKGDPPQSTGKGRKVPSQITDRNEIQGLLQSAMQEFLERTRAVAVLVGSVGSEALGSMPEPVSATFTRMLGSLEQLFDQAPPLTAEFDALIEQIHAQRLTLQALQAQLAAFDHQLGVLEKTLAPLEGWAHQWSRMRQSLTETLQVAAPKPGSPAD